MKTQSKIASTVRQDGCFSCALDGDFVTEKGTSCAGCGRAAFSSGNADFYFFNDSLLWPDVHLVLLKRVYKHRNG